MRVASGPNRRYSGHAISAYLGDLCSGMAHQPEHAMTISVPTTIGASAGSSAKHAAALLRKIRMRAKGWSDDRQTTRVLKRHLRSDSICVDVGAHTWESSDADAAIRAKSDALCIRTAATPRKRNSGGNFPPPTFWIVPSATSREPPTSALSSMPQPIADFVRELTIVSIPSSRRLGCKLPGWTTPFPGM
jgi:hypothetical protein